MNSSTITAIVPAAGIGSRMQSDIPKQYLKLGEQCILELTLRQLLSNDNIDSIVVALHKDDIWFNELPSANNAKINTILGGESRADSVIQALALCQPEHWALVHDAARPCVRQADIKTIINYCMSINSGGAILAVPVKDTMKRSHNHNVQSTVCRENLWHALTPQMFNCGELLSAYRHAQENDHVITDEASAMEYVGASVKLINAHPGNIKITRPEDLALAAFYMNKES